MALRSETRACPQCGKVKTFPVRNEFCSRECSADNQRKAQPLLTEQSRITGNEWEISLPKTRIHTLEQLLEYCEVDQKVWEVERFVVNKWEVGRKDKAIEWQVVDGQASGTVRDTGKIFVEPLYQVKATLRRRVDLINIRAEIESLKAEAMRAAPRFKAIKRPRKLSGNMLELTIPDLHLGKLAWSKETGYGDYDVRIAERTFETAVNELIGRTSSFTFDKIVLVIGNDMLNADNVLGTTTQGTPQANDTRYQKTFDIGRQMLTRAIERLREIAPVHVLTVPGNHDRVSAWHMGYSLYCYFHRAKDVTVDYDPTPRKYHQFGKVMLMWTHGDEGKRQDYPLLMATEQPRMFGETRYREAHTGDKHQTQAQEWRGVMVRILPSLCKPDDWHSRKTYVGNLERAEAYVWNKEQGLICTAIYTVPE